MKYTIYERSAGGKRVSLRVPTKAMARRLIRRLNEAQLDRYLWMEPPGNPQRDGTARRPSFGAPD